MDENVNEEEVFIKTSDLCKKLNVVRSTVSAWRKQGLPCEGKGRSYRYKYSEVLKWLEDQRKKEEK